MIEVYGNKMQAIKNPAFRAGFWTSDALVIEYGVVASSFFSYTPVKHSGLPWIPYPCITSVSATS